MAQLPEKVFYILVSIAVTIILFWLGRILYEPFGLLYAMLIPSIVFIFFSIIIILGKCNWFKELINKEYNLYLDAYQKYQKDVLEKKGVYENIFDDYCNSIEFFPVPIDANGTSNANVLNSENVIRKRIQKVLSNRKDLVEKYFTKDRFRYGDFTNLMDEYKKTMAPNTDKKIELNVINFINTSRKTKGTKIVGDRLFGYYLKSKSLTAITLSQCEEEWAKLIKEHKPVDGCRYIKTPDHFGDKSEINATIDALQKIEEFFIINEKGQIVEIIKNDIKKLEETRPKENDIHPSEPQ